MKIRALLPLATLLAACDWISLAHGALTYDTLRAGEAGSIVVVDSLVLVAIGDSGIALVHTRNGARVGLVPPPSGSESVDDLAVANGVVFALDARPPGHVSTFSLDRDQLTLRSSPRAVDVGPFSGIDARDGLCVVSGGTSQLTLWRYDASGALSGPIASADLGRGQPDVALGRAGVMYVSTHYWGPNFGIDIVRFDSAASELHRIGALPLEGAGFTSGGAKPANFPIDAALVDDTTLAVAYARGLAVVNVRDPERPALSRIVDVGGRAVSLDVHDGEAVVAVAGSRAAIVRVDLRHTVPHVTRRAPLPAGTNPLGVAFSWDRSVVAARDKGALVLR
jgi:hypothetical protein